MFSYDSLPFVKFGYLHKQARKSKRNWKKRWVVVNLKQRVISYYKTKKAFEKKQKPAGSFGLPPPEDSFVGPSSTSRMNSFEIYKLNRGSGQKETLLTLASDTVDNMDKWIEMIDQICQGSNSLDNTNAAVSNNRNGSASKNQTRRSAKEHIHAHQQRQSIVAFYGKSRRSVVMDNDRVPAKIQIVGAGSHEADGMYRLSRVVPNSNMLAAYMSNDGYRLVLMDGMKGARPQWNIIEPGNAERILYISNNVKKLLPAANDWRTDLGLEPPPVLQLATAEAPPALTAFIAPPPPLSTPTSTRKTSNGLSIVTQSDAEIEQQNKNNNNAENEQTKQLVFTKSFLNGKKYSHKNLLTHGQMPGTPSLKISYTFLKGAYLNPGLRKILPPRPIKGETNDAKKRRRSIEHRPQGRPSVVQTPGKGLGNVRPPPLWDNVQTPGKNHPTPPWDAQDEENGIDYEVDSQNDSEDDEIEDFYEYNKTGGKREREEEQERSKLLPPPPTWNAPPTPGPPKRLPLPPPIFNNTGLTSFPGPPGSGPPGSGPPGSGPPGSGPPPSFSNIPGPPPSFSNIAGPPPSFSHIPGPPPLAKEHLPSAPSFKVSNNVPAAKKRKSGNNNKSNRSQPPSIPTAPAYVPGLEKDRMKKKRSSNLDAPSVPQMPSFVPGLMNAPTTRGNRNRRVRKGKKTTGLNGMNMGKKSLAKKGSLHVMHKTTAHTTSEVHDNHVPPHLRL